MKRRIYQTYRLIELGRALKVIDSKGHIPQTRQLGPGERKLSTKVPWLAKSGAKIRIQDSSPSPNERSRTGGFRPMDVDFVDPPLYSW